MTKRFEVLENLPSAEKGLFFKLNQFIDTVGGEFDIDELDKLVRFSANSLPIEQAVFFSEKFEGANKKAIVNFFKKPILSPKIKAYLSRSDGKIKQLDLLFNMITTGLKDIDPRITTYITECATSCLSDNSIDSIINPFGANYKSGQYSQPLFLNLLEKIFASYQQYLGNINYNLPERTLLSVGLKPTQIEVIKAQSLNYAGYVKNDATKRLITKDENLLAGYALGKLRLSELDGHPICYPISLKDIIAAYKNLDTESVSHDKYSDILGHLECFSVLEAFKHSLSGSLRFIYAGTRNPQKKLRMLEIINDVERILSEIEPNNGLAIPPEAQGRAKPAHDDGVVAVDTPDIGAHPEQGKLLQHFRTAVEKLSPNVLNDYIKKATEQIMDYVNQGYTEFNCKIDFAGRSKNYPIILVLQNPKAPDQSKEITIEHNLYIFPQIISLKQALQTAVLDLKHVTPHYSKKSEVFYTEIIPQCECTGKLAFSTAGFTAEISFSDSDGQTRTAKIPLGVKATRQDQETLSVERVQADERLQELVCFINLARLQRQRFTVNDLVQILKNVYSEQWHSPDGGESLVGYNNSKKYDNDYSLSAVTFYPRADINPTYVVSFSITLPNGEKISKAVNLHTDNVILAEARALEVLEAVENCLAVADPHSDKTSFLPNLLKDMPHYEHEIGVHVDTEHVENGKRHLVLQLIRNPSLGQNSLTLFFAKVSGNVRPVRREIVIDDDLEWKQLVISTLADDLRKGIKDHYNGAANDKPSGDHRYDTRTVVNCLDMALAKLLNEMR